MRECDGWKSGVRALQPGKASQAMTQRLNPHVNEFFHFSASYFRLMNSLTREMMCFWFTVACTPSVNKGARHWVDAPNTCVEVTRIIHEQNKKQQLIIKGAY